MQARRGRYGSSGRTSFGHDAEARSRPRGMSQSHRIPMVSGEDQKHKELFRYHCQSCLRMLSALKRKMLKDIKDCITAYVGLTLP